MKQTNMIDKVTELKMLGEKATHGECIVIEDDDRSGDFIIIQSKEHWAWKDGSNSPDAKYLAAMRNAAPKMIAALGKIREGDANEIDYAIQELSRVFGPENVAETIAVLHRYRDMARMMEKDNEESDQSESQQKEKDDYKYVVVDSLGPHEISIGGKTFLSADVDENRLKQLANKDTELVRWQQIAIDKLNEKDRYIERLENDFIFYARSYEYLRDPDKWKPHQERYKKAEQKAQDVLNEIRKRKL